MDKELNTLLADIKRDLTAYLNIKFRLIKLETYEKSGFISSLMIYSLVVLLLIFFAFLFLCLALGFYIGELLGSLGTGMVLVAMIYLLTLCILLSLRKKLLNWLTNMFVEQINQSDDERNEEVVGS